MIAASYSLVSFFYLLFSTYYFACHAYFFDHRLRTAIGAQREEAHVVTQVT